MNSDIRDDYDDDYDPSEFDDGDDSLSDLDFADPGGNSALRAATIDDPRIHPCPTCLTANRLTRRDISHGYQCDQCADIIESGGY